MVKKETIFINERERKVVISPLVCKVAPDSHGARTEQRKEQITPDWQVAGLISSLICTRLVLCSCQTNRPLPLDHQSPRGLNRVQSYAQYRQFQQHLPSQGSALRTEGMIGRVYILRTGEKLKSLPSIGQVLLIGHLVVVFSPTSSNIYLFY